MASFKTLFLAVYASNSAVRAFFLPICYVVLFSPFFILIGYFFGFGNVIARFIPEDFMWIDLLPQFALSAVFLLLPTRLLSASRDSGVSSNDQKKRKVQAIPYWIPGLQHLTSIIFGGEDWLKSIRKSAISNIIAYKTVGTKHNIILNDSLSHESLLSQVFQNRTHLEEPRISKWATLQNAFRMPKQINTQYFECEQVVRMNIQSEIFAERSTNNLMAATLRNLSETLPDFVTFNSSIVDQMQWERVADVELTDGTSEAEISLFALLNEFCCNAILPPVVGSHFTESYQLLATDLAAFNQRYWALALGLPRLSPIGGLPGAALSKKRLHQNFTKLFKDLTNPPQRHVPDDDESVSGEEDTDADVPTPISQLNDLFTELKLPMEARASIGMQLIHRIVAEVVPLTFWSLLQILSLSTEQAPDTKVLHKIKEQTKAWAQAIQPPSIHPSFPAPPEIIFGAPNGATSLTSFADLRACINEARRLYNVSVATYQVKQPLLLKETSVKETWELDTGSYIDVGLSQALLNSSPDVFPEPETFKPDRFLESLSSATSIRSSIEDTEPYMTAIIIAIVTGIIQLWEIAPAPKKTFFEHMQEAREEAQMGAAALSGDQRAARSSQVRERKDKDKKEAKWVLPTADDGAHVKVPRGDIRVRVRRREGLPERRVGARR